MARVAAANAKGWGAASPANSVGATAKTLPAQSAAVTRGSETAPAYVEVDWTALTGSTDTGGLSITSYNLEYDQGSGEPAGGASWSSLVGSPSASLLLTYTLNGAGVVTGGQAYQFRVRANNPLGWGPWSTITVVWASAAPA